MVAAAGADITIIITATGADIAVSQAGNLIFLEQHWAKAAVAHVYLPGCGIR